MKSNLPLCLGITGGIGSGKSYVCHLLESQGIPIFYTDDEAKAEMRENPIIHEELVALIGPEAIGNDGTPSKPVLAAYICQGNDYAERVNQIVHPRVKERTLRWIGQQKGCEVVGIECALLFESGFDNICQKTITVAAPLHLRIERICQRDNITPQQAMHWIDLQMSQEEKVNRSDYCIINDGESDLLSQIESIITDNGINLNKK